MLHCNAFYKNNINIALNNKRKTNVLYAIVADDNAVSTVANDVRDYWVDASDCSARRHDLLKVQHVNVARFKNVLRINKYLINNTNIFVYLIVINKWIVMYRWATFILLV